MALSLTVFEINGNLPHPRTFNASAEEVPLEFYNVGGKAQKLEWCHYPTVKKCDDVSIR